jgi:phosphoglycolate phosphatase
MAYETIFFDLDGTLCDPGKGIERSVQYALGKLGIEEEDDKNLRQFVGPPLEHTFVELYGLNDGQIEQAVTHYRERFGTEGIGQYTVYKGVLALLERLNEREKYLAVVTSKPTVFAEKVLEHVGLTSLFRFIAGRGLGQNVVKAVTLEEAITRAGLEGGDLDSMVMVGDREHDIIAAQAQSRPTSSIGVLYGYGSEEEIVAARPTHIAKTVSDLAKLTVED